MAKQLVLQNLMKLAQGIGANPQKFMGTRTNISFLGKGPTKNPLFQGPLAGLESATEAQLGPREAMISAVEDAMGFATANKLNSIQIRALELNLENIFKIYNPPVLPSASVTNIGAGIEGLRRFPKESHKFFGRPLKDKDFSEIDRLVAEGKLPPAGVKGATSIGPVKGRSYKYVDEQGKTRIMPSKEWSEGAKRAIKEGEEMSKLPEPGSAGVTAMLDQKTGMSRAIAREILQKDVRLNLKPEELYSLRTGAEGADPIDLMVKYYGRSIENFDEFLNSVNLQAAAPAEFAEMVLKHVRLIPQFAHGGLARILEV